MSEENTEEKTTIEVPKSRHLILLKKERVFDAVKELELIQNQMQELNQKAQGLSLEIQKANQEIELLK